MGAGKRAAAAIAAGLLGAALAGCGAGQDAPTSLELPSVPGVAASAEDGSVLVRNAHVVFDPDGYPAGQEAPVRLWLANETYEPVRLLAASSAEAASVDVGGGIEVPPTSVVEATLRVSGLQRQLGGTAGDPATTAALPLTLSFDNDVELVLAVTMAPPMDAQPRQPLDLDDH